MPSDIGELRFPLCNSINFLFEGRGVTDPLPLASNGDGGVTARWLACRW